jgi:hypothetical protein
MEPLAMLRLNRTIRDILSEPPPNPSRYTVSMQYTKLVFELRGAVQYDLDSGQRDRLKNANTVDVSSQEHARRGALRVTCRPR